MWENAFCVPSGEIVSCALGGKIVFCALGGKIVFCALGGKIVFCALGDKIVCCPLSSEEKLIRSYFLFQISEKIPLKKLEEKYERVIRYCEKEIENILKVFRKQKHDPPLAGTFPPLAGI